MADDWIWGNRRGGGGAPLRNAEGSVVTNLRQVIRGSVDVETTSRLPTNKDYEQQQFFVKPYIGDPLVRNTSHVYHTVDSPPPVITQQSPKRFMSSLREMSIDPADRDIRLRKELEYQEALRFQIDEKKRRKEEEKIAEERIKQRELEDYLRNQYRGSPLDVEQALAKVRNGGSKSLYRRGESDRDYPFEPPRDSFRLAQERSENGRRDDNGRSKIGYSERDNVGKGGVSALRLKGADHSYRNDGDPYIETEDSKFVEKLTSRSDQGATHLLHRGDALTVGQNEGSYVSKEEYDDLSQLCSQLLGQQRDLQDALDRQAEMIESLRSGGVGSKISGKVSATERFPVRSRSTNGRMEKASQVTPGEATAGGEYLHPTISSRKTQSKALADDGHAQRQALQHRKVAFGAVAPVAAEVIPYAKSVSNSRVSTNSKRVPPAKLVSRGGGIPTTAGAGGLQAKLKPRRSDSPPTGPSVTGSKSVLSGNNAFAKLALAGKVKPIVVTYDNDSVEAIDRLKSQRTQPSVARSAPHQSTELRSESEHIRIGRREDDIISGDQLDRLLAQARRARVT